MRKGKPCTSTVKFTFEVLNIPQGDLEEKRKSRRQAIISHVKGQLRTEYPPKPYSYSKRNKRKEES